MANGNRQFFHGDVIARVGILEKFLVWCVDRNQYHLMIVDEDIASKVSGPYVDMMYDIGRCHENFVKVGTWDFYCGKEEEDDE